MADLRSSTSIGGNLAWHSGNLKLDPQGNTLRYAGYKIYSELDKPTAAEINVYTKTESDARYTLANVYGFVSKGGDTMSGKLTVTGNDIEITGTSPRLTLTDTDSSNKLWLLVSNSNQLYITEDGPSTVRFALSSSLVNFNVSDFQLNAKAAIRGYDAWLRLNDTQAFASGVYFGASLVRTDGSLQVGSTATAGLYASTTALQWKGTEVFTANSYTTLDSRYVNASGDSMSGNLTAPTFIGALSGNATTATTLQTARTINGVSFNGSANITVADSTKLPLSGGTLTGNLTAPTFIGALTGNATGANQLNSIGNTDANVPLSGTGLKAFTNSAGSLNFPSVYGTGFEFNRNAGVTTSEHVVQMWAPSTQQSQLYLRMGSGNGTTITWGSWSHIYHAGYNNIGTGATNYAAGNHNHSSISGNAATATTLQTARTINGVSFNGSANITVYDSSKLPLTGGTLTGQLGFTDANANTTNQAHIFHSATGTNGVEANIRSMRESTGSTWLWEKVASGGIRYSTGTTGAGTNSIILQVSDGTVNANKFSINGNAGYFHGDANYTQFSGSNFYITSSVPITYIYSPSIYLGSTSGTTVLLRGNTIGGTGWNISGTGTITGASIVGPLSGNATTATTLQTARTINGVSFNGSANITITAAANGGTSSASNALIRHDTRADNPPPSGYDDTGVTYHFKQNTTNGFTQGGGTYNRVLNLDAWGGISGGLSSQMAFGDNGAVGYRPSSDDATWGAWKTFVFTGDNIGTGASNYAAGNHNHSSISGNAATATTLQTARTINGVSFNGSANITITAAANGGTSAACSGNATTATTLQTARTINGVSFNGSANITVADSTKLPLTGGTLTGILAANAGISQDGHTILNGSDTWLRTLGATGWYSTTYNGGVYMEDTTYVKTYGSKALYIGNSIVATGNVTAYSSDSRLKDIVERIDPEEALKNVIKWDKVKYKWNATAQELAGYSGDIVEVGLLADKISEDYPELTPLAPFDEQVTEFTGEKSSKSGMNYKTLDYGRLVAVQAAAIECLANKISALEARLNQLENN